MGRLDGKVALVTGAGRGIGKAIARLFAQEGAAVAVCSRTPGNVEAVVADIAGSGGRAIGVVCDIGNPESIADTVARTVAAFGRLDIVVNNAFDVTTIQASVLELPVGQLQRQIDTGPVATLLMMQAAYPHLKASGAGRVINFGSAVGVQGTAGFAPYAMAKEAIRALTRVAAREWGADGITVNNILPIARTEAYDSTTSNDADWIPDTAIPRMGNPATDIAPVAVFLASAESGFMTGYSLTPDGGYLIDGAR